jgi:carbonic anhydrase/acetyltransferase-like protein (isoleucine patch superfamily)
MEYGTTDGQGAPYIAPGARLVGDVRLQARVSVWYNAVIRADARKIVIGEDSNIQDNATLHVELDHDIHIGKGVTVGHNAIVHGCTIGDHTVVGMGAIVMTGAVVGKDCIIGAGALVTENSHIPDGSLVVGIPGKVVRSLTEEEIQSNYRNAQHYVELAAEYRGSQPPDSK